MKRFYDYLLTSQLLQRARFLLPSLFLATLISFSVTISSVQSTAEGNGETAKVLPRRQPVASATPTTAEVCRETQKVLDQIERELKELERTDMFKKEEEDYRYALSALDKAIATGTLIDTTRLHILLEGTEVETPINTITGQKKEPGEWTIQERSALQRTVRPVLKRELEEAANTTWARLEDRIAKNKTQRNIREQRMIDLNCSDVLSRDTGDGGTGDANKWDGVFTESPWTFTLTSNGSTLSGTFEYKDSEAKDDGKLVNCKVNGNTVTGDWTAEHDDTHKTGKRKGTFTATLSGNTLSGQLLEDTPPEKWKWKPSYNGGEYQSKMVKGAVWAFSVTRKN